MSIFDDANMAIIERAFTKEHILESISNAKSNNQDVLLHINEYPTANQLSSYATLSWALDKDTYLGDKKNTANYELSHITASFCCDVSVIDNVRNVSVTHFCELEIEHEDASKGLDGNFFLGRDEELAISPIDFESILKEAASIYNKNIHKGDYKINLSLK